MSSILVICFFPAFTPASSGGELRLGKLYRAVSRTHDVTLLTSTDFGARFEEIIHAPKFRELRFPKDEFWRNAYATLEGTEVTGDLSGLAFSLAVSDPRCFLRVRARELANVHQYVIHEFPFSEPIFSDGCPSTELYNSHNFEASLLSSIVRGDGFDVALLKLIRLEGNLVARAKRVFSTSREDAEKFRLFYGPDPTKLGICPNGFDELELEPVTAARRTKTAVPESRPKLLFTGSAHHPNVEAAAFVMKLAVELSECDVVLAGGVCQAFATYTLPPNVELVGPFDEARKFELLTRADIFLNPVIFGSGTSLKALEALGAGVPMVSTEEGVRGLGLKSGEHCEIVTREEFSNAVRGLLRDRERAATIALAGKAFAIRRFSWERIATKFVDEIGKSVTVGANHRPLILALNDYSVMQPGSGGATRVRNLLENLGCDVILVSFASAFEVGFVGAGVLHVTIPKTAAHREFEEAANDGQAMSVNDAVASLFVAANRVLAVVISAIALRAQAVVFEHPYMAPLLDVLVRIGKKLPVIYSSHNVEATHKAAILKEHTIGQTLGRFITELEVRLASVADLIVCCTDMDAKHFSQLCSNTIVIPNGCTAPIGASRNALRHREIKRVGFLGSGHGPNVEAAEFIAEEMAPFFPDITFELIGGVCASLSWALPSNVLLHGMVSESVKSGLMIQWDIGLNPVLSGGGSSLKLPDYLSHGLATLSTPAGARGFAILEHQAGRVATRRNFRSTLADMVRNPVGLERDRINGRQYADSHLSWSAITAQYRERLGALLVAGTSRGSGRKLLVVTYRYTEPPLGGAEEYLIEVLKRLRPQFERLDLAAIDVGHLTNHHHFGCRLSSHGGATLRVGEIFDQALFFDPELLPEPEMLTGSRELERAWCREELTLLAPFAHQMAMQGKLRLFAGFYWPENQEGIIRRWTSPEFSFLIPQSTRAFQMAGFASQEKKVRVSFMRVMHDGKMEVRARFEQTIAPYFRFNIALPEYVGEDALILAFEVDEHHAPGDHRPFGVLLESAWVLLDGHGAWNGQREAIDPLEIGIADLREQYQDELRTDSFERWVGALHYTASRRAPNMEDSFAALRGPHSPRLQAWIANNASNYDAILVQGIPFDVVPRTVETLRALPNRPRIITLPHFHGDDRFYHWRRYCSAFEAADATMLFSSSVAERIGSTANFVCVPGGGIRTDELAVTTAERRFADVHQDKEPFFLVLGRKTGSKGYQRALRAHQELRSLGAKVGLVLIGPDEDGYPVSGEAVYYLGRQPREVICGALSACIALVTMSQSESFGIVLCEAWLFGKPVIANRACYSFRELVDDGETGYLVTTDSELTEAMRNLANRPTERDRMGETGFQNTLHRFTWETVADSCLKVLDGRSESEPHGFPGPS